ncbi:MAG TPA: glucosamine-6-phosphate isomerase [Prolixibacteraceae bacterium]|jgi:glucosamine-6-phosphate deaminase|nr:glucosamine-6-phosphate isomerase [Prolixibacteraceae bacterium]
MRTNEFSNVEKVFLQQAAVDRMSTKMPYITVENFPKLGMLTSLRFLEWVAQNPNGVISLPTGKTPEYFIKFTHFFLDNWDTKKGQDILSAYGLSGIKKPSLSGLQFVQMDEFYPIASKQHNSFYNYVDNFYIKGFGLDAAKSLLINSDAIPLAEGKSYNEVFPDLRIDLSLRYRDAKSPQERLQQRSILSIDDWCSEYELKIREKGGIGFWLGGIGPDGHIAFNTRGSDHFSTTRLTATNFETQAVAAGDLGGIEVSRNRLVITIGLETITFNPQTVALVFAAGEAKADVIKDALESEPSNQFPGSCLHKLPNSRFYLTTGAAVKLTDSVDQYYQSGEWTHQKSERAIIDLCPKINKFGHRLTLEDLQEDKYTRMIPNLDENTVQTVIDSITAKFNKGMEHEANQVFYHTGPHHDDIMLGIMPQVARQLRDASNEFHLSVPTSGFTAVINQYVIDLLNESLHLISDDQIQMIKFPDFFEEGYQYKWDKDIYHYLDSVAANDAYEQRRGVCHRVIRSVVQIWGIKNELQLIATIIEILDNLTNSYDGSKNPPKIQVLKGMIREMEEELVWAHFGVPVKNVHHLRLGFYQGDIFTEQPDDKRDVLPILEEFRKYKPTVISLAMDPEGSGPDTHYKVLKAIAAAVKEWKKEEDLSKLRVIGYRNVWFRFHPADTEVIVPVSLNALAILDTSFSQCYLSQVNASFPSYQLDGKFSELTQKIWVEQLKQIQFLLGKNFFYQHEKPLVRATHGLIYIREMNADQFLKQAEELERSMEGVEL